MIFIITVLGMLIVGITTNDPQYFTAAGVWMLVAIQSSGYTIRR